MTYFEFISVALSLIFALAISDILRSLVPASAKSARFLPHIGWLVATFLLITYVWISLWRVKSIEWTGPIFVYSFLSPAITTVMARLLTTHSPESIDSFKEQFYGSKNAFFVLFLLFCINGFVFFWIVGFKPWWTIETPQIGSLLGATIAVLGIYLKADTSHYILAGVTVMVLLALITLVPAYA
jgi:uncharacterized membrane protein